MNKRVSKWSDLSQWGINCLTGEADPYGMRLLCDLTEQGQEIIRAYFSLPSTTTFYENWNSGATGSILLPRDLLFPLAKYIFFHIEKVFAVAVTDTYIQSISESLANDYFEHPIKGIGVYRNYNDHPGMNRNLHHFTGRMV